MKRSKFEWRVRDVSKRNCNQQTKNLSSWNQELLDKQEEFNTARYYAEIIVTTIREPLIVLDKKTLH
jgi:two-component system CheB/CheR fusion protein